LGAIVTWVNGESIANAAEKWEIGDVAEIVRTRQFGERPAAPLARPSAVGVGFSPSQSM